MAPAETGREAGQVLSLWEQLKRLAVLGPGGVAILLGGAEERFGFSVVLCRYQTLGIYIHRAVGFIFIFSFYIFISLLGVVPRSPSHLSYLDPSAV